MAGAETAFEACATSLDSAALCRGILPEADHRAPAPMKVRSAMAIIVVWDVAQPRIRRAFVRRKFNVTR